MPILDATLAFALTMLVVATTVTIIVEFIHKLLKVRAKTLESMLNHYLHQELQPVLARELSRLGDKVDESFKEQLMADAKKLSTNSLFAEISSTAQGNNASPSTINGKILINRYQELITSELIERLKRSTLGHNLLRNFRQDADRIFDEFAIRYEQIGKYYSATFRKNSRQLSTLVAFILALIINIDSINILNNFIRNESLREAVISNMQAISKQYENTVKQYQNNNGSSTNNNSNKKTFKELSMAVEKTRNEINRLSDLGLPIGYDYFPYQSCPDSTELKSINNCDKMNEPSQWFFWIIGLLLTAALAGLGAPFWYDIVTGVSRLTQKNK